MIDEASAHYYRERSRESENSARGQSMSSLLSARWAQAAALTIMGAF